MRERRIIRVLSIDGGGIRGVIPARMLVELEDVGGMRVAELFDVIAGTSTGGILGLGCAAPGAEGQPRFAATALLSLYEDHGGAIFPGGGKPTLRQWLLGPSGGTALGRDVWGAAQRIGSIFGGNPRYAGNARYFPAGLDGMLQHTLGDTPLGAAVTNVVVTAYDMRGATPVLFRSYDHQGSDEPRMRDVARATSAGPTYFPPVEMDVGGRGMVLVDGGLAANNPAMIAYAEAARLYPGAEYLVLSLGTGTKSAAADSDQTFDAIRTRNWAQTAGGVFSAVMDGTSETQDQALRALLNRPTEPARYWRLQSDLGRCNFALDDASASNVACLREVAEQLARSSRPVLEELVARAHAVRR